MNASQDPELERGFAALRAEEAERALPASAIVARARARAADTRPRRWRPGPAAIAVGAAAVLGWLGWSARPDALPPLDPAATGSLRMASDVLLETPGRDLLRGLPLPSFDTDANPRPPEAPQRDGSLHLRSERSHLS